MTRDEAIDIAKALTSLPGFPRGDAGDTTLGDCVTILEDSCQDATQAKALVSQFTPRRWPGIPAFQTHIENPTREARQLAALGAQFRPTEPGRAVELYPGFELPAWVSPPGATDAVVGRNVIKYSDQLHAKAWLTINKLSDRRRRALLLLAESGARIDVPLEKTQITAEPKTGAAPTYEERFEKAKQFRASLYLLEMIGWARRDGVAWKSFFWHYIDVQKWMAESGDWSNGRGQRRPFPTRPVASTK